MPSVLPDDSLTLLQSNKKNKQERIHHVGKSINFLRGINHIYPHKSHFNHGVGLELCKDKYVYHLDITTLNVS